MLPRGQRHLIDHLVRDCHPSILSSRFNPFFLGRRDYTSTPENEAFEARWYAEDDDSDAQSVRARGGQLLRTRSAPAGYRYGGEIASFIVVTWRGALL